MDDADRASPEIDAYIAEAIRRTLAAPVEHFTRGVCPNCDAQLRGLRFCDDDCAKDYRARQARGVM